MTPPKTESHDTLSTPDHRTVDTVLGFSHSEAHPLLKAQPLKFKKRKYSPLLYSAFQLDFHKHIHNYIWSSSFI